MNLFQGECSLLTFCRDHQFCYPCHALSLKLAHISLQLWRFSELVGGSALTFESEVSRAHEWSGMRIELPVATQPRSEDRGCAARIHFSLWHVGGDVAQD